MNTTQISKLISLVLRHHPEKLGLTLDAHGWADTRALIEAINAIQPFDARSADVHFLLCGLPQPKRLGAMEE